MTRIFKAVLCLCLTSSLLSYRTSAQTDDSKDASKSCRGFTQSFYDWYVPIVLKDGSRRAVKRVLDDRNRELGSNLRRLLQQDSHAQDVADKGPGGYIVGLDFDPFLSGQDFDGHYQVGKSTAKGGSCFAEVFGRSSVSGQLEEHPEVIAEVTHSGDEWRIVNVHYPRYGQGKTLVTILRDLQKTRQEHPLPK